MRTLTTLFGALCLVLAVLVWAPPTALSQDTSSSLSVETTHQQLVLMPKGGFGRFTETHLEQNAAGASFGLAARWYLTARTRLTAQVLAALRERQFIPTGVGAAGGAEIVTENELVLDFNAAYNFDLWNHERHGIWVYAGWRHGLFINDGFDQQLSGAITGVQFEFQILKQLMFQTFADYTFNLMGITDRATEVGDSLIGDVLGSIHFGGGLRFFPDERWQLGIAYDGEHLSYEHSDVLIHQAVLEIGISFDI